MKRFRQTYNHITHGVISFHDGVCKNILKKLFSYASISLNYIWRQLKCTYKFNLNNIKKLINKYKNKFYDENTWKKQIRNKLVHK